MSLAKYDIDVCLSNFFKFQLLKLKISKDKYAWYINACQAGDISAYKMLQREKYWAWMFLILFVLM